jgi:3-deoxy-D-manno-octulosonic-acid transferase
MSRIFFIFLLVLASIIRWPLSFLLVVLKIFSKSLKKRIDFERKNLIESSSRSFKFDNEIADYCFEVSSEGELEQVRPLIEHYLSLNKRIEIIFASASVEGKCIKMSLDFGNQIRILRLPIASFAPFDFLFFQSPWSWVSAPVIIFCRYDFYPELLCFKYLGKKLVLLSAASKKPSWFKHQAHSLFNLIIAANEGEARYFKETFKNIKVFAFDFRIPRIYKRIALASKTLESTLELSSYLSFLNSLSPAKKLIMGSAWESDLVILQNRAENDFWVKDLSKGNLHLLIVPHDLSSKSINNLKHALKSLMPSVALYEISKDQKFDTDLFRLNPGIVILNLSGILCELYTKFSLVYVGGGHERSIHSVLEPFLSGAQVVCGPKITRSTEFDYIKDVAPEKIHLLNNPESFYNLTKEKLKEMHGVLRPFQLENESYTHMESIIKEIEIC